MIKKHLSPKKVVNIAAILVTIASLFAAVCWITSGKANGEADEREMVALVATVSQLEAATTASTARVEEQTYLGYEQMYLAYAASASDENTRLYLENLANEAHERAIARGLAAEDAENRATLYLGRSDTYLGEAKRFSRIAEYRSTGALVLNIAAILGSLGVLSKRKELLYMYFPILATGAGYFITSLI